ncbi:hypothetical protein Vadar_006658 [Vaccinium darrowii]|uniref:Uncharacterized protein n=1 Tax=Vaccinium darrowii TaxID=229202 RepID=A0ACB7XXD1_9ERIC|nr:hypothetical protein Vadar_006658 [Vaccinium darrowii]
MNSYFFSICHLSFLVLILILVPTSSGSDNEQYTSCRRPFECANIRNLSYPFWGGSRPQYCGHPNFGLNCTNQAPQITINSIPYRVLSIDYPTKTLTVARAEFWNNPCPSPTTLYKNATLDGAPFAYSNDSQDMIILFGCQALPGVTLDNQFSCTNDGTTTASYFIITSGGGEVSNGFGTFIPGCNSSVVVRFNQTAALGLADARPSYIYVKRVLDSGFGLRWDANDPICSGCAQSGGVCGSDSGSGFSCYCSDKVYPVACNSTRGGSGMCFSSLVFTCVLLKTWAKLEVVH